MPGYAKVARDLWDDKRFRALAMDSQLLLFYLLTTRHSNSFGYYVIDDAYICADMQVKPARLVALWRELIESGFVRRDPEARLVLIVNALLENRPENPNVTKKWRTMLDALPDSHLRRELVRLAHAYLRGSSWVLDWLGPSDTLQLGLLEESPEGFRKGSERVTEESPEESSKESEEVFRNPLTPIPYPVTQNPEPLSPSASSLRSEAADAQGNEGQLESWILRVRSAKNGKDTVAILGEFALGQYEGPGPENGLTDVEQLLKAVAPEHLLKTMWQAAEEPREDFLVYVRDVLRQEELDAGT